MPCRFIERTTVLVHSFYSHPAAFGKCIIPKGDMVFLQFEMASPDECLGRDALVTLPGEDGRELLRRVLPGSRVGTYALKTHNGGGVIETPLAGARVVLGSVKAEGLQ